MITTISFDIGGTILFADPGIPEIFARVAQKRGHDVQIDDVTPYLPAINEYYEHEYARNGDFWCKHDQAVQIWLDMYALMATYVNIDDSDLPEAIYHEYLKACNWTIYNDVLPFLNYLKKNHYKTVVVSNWDATLENLIRSLDLLPFFDEVVASAAVGCRKPEPAIFEIALERMQCRPEEMIHIGDLPQADGDGAYRCNITPIIIDRDNIHNGTDYTLVRSMNEIPHIIEKLNKINK